MDQAPSPHGNDMFDMGDDGRGFDGFGSNPAVSIGMGAASMGMGGIVQQGEFSRQSMSQGMASRDFFGGHIQHAGLAGQASQGMDPRGWDSEHSPVPRNMYARAEARPSSHRQETQSTNLYRQHMRVAPAHEIHKPAALSGPPASFATKKRPRVDKVTAAPSDSSSSKRSRAEKHYKEIRLLCDALAPHIRDVKVTDCVYLPARAPRAHGFPIWQCNERAVQMYDKYRDSGKAAGRPSRPMYAAVVLAMSGEEDEEGDESDCKKRLQLLTNACSAVWGTDAPDKRKIWDSLIVLLRIVPLRCPQDNLAGSVLSRSTHTHTHTCIHAHTYTHRHTHAHTACCPRRLALHAVESSSDWAAFLPSVCVCVCLRAWETGSSDRSSSPKCRRTKRRRGSCSSSSRPRSSRQGLDRNSVGKIRRNATNLHSGLYSTTLQGPLAGKAPKTVAACTMHLYCRHSHVGMQAARTIATSLQVGESTVRTNLRGIYVGGASGNSQVSQKRPVTEPCSTENRATDTPAHPSAQRFIPDAAERRCASDLGLMPQAI